MYLHVYLICTQGPKMIFESAARLVPWPRWAFRSAGRPPFTRVHRRTFQRSACDCSASFVCTLTAEDWSSQCLKHTLLLASMTNLSTTVVMLCVFMSTSIVFDYFFFFCNLLLAVLKDKTLWLFVFCFFFYSISDDQCSRFLVWASIPSLSGL